MSITCEICGSRLYDDGSYDDDADHRWCNTCEDTRPIDSSGHCKRCGMDPDASADEPSGDES